jgi:hypothetical protein
MYFLLFMSFCALWLKKDMCTNVRIGSPKPMDIISIIIMTSRLLLLHENHGLYIHTTKDH